jgi:hypothetical protein
MASLRHEKLIRNAASCQPKPECTTHTMNIAQIEQNIQRLVAGLSYETFVYELLSAYGLPKAAITRLKNGAYNLAKGQNEVLWKKKLYFQVVSDEDIHSFIDTARKLPHVARNEPRFVVVTDFQILLAYDTKTNDTLDIPLSELARYFDFFLPWAGMEKAQAVLDNPADVKAAEKMARLYDLIRQDNPDHFQDSRSIHDLNVFLSRLLFCYFAEDTEIFTSKLFTNSISSHTQQDGTDLHRYLDDLFTVLNTDDRSNQPAYLAHFPYVNGGLFAQQVHAPVFTARSRKMLIDCGRDLNWADINPDIFGSMIQAVVHPDQRSAMGMHYTSVVNIMKIIEPLFLNDLRDEFEKHLDDPKRLQSLLTKLSSLRFFDPACGSGNFLIISYKELRKLEIDIFKRLQSVSSQWKLPISSITLSQFYGIELDDFAHEIAILSLWLTEHQMNVAFKKTFGQSRPSLPLRESGHVVKGNAARLNWAQVCPYQDEAEIYVFGNPPYLGARNQEPTHKADLCHVFEGREEYKDADYVSCWILKAADFISGKASRFAFVTTNSINQGEQVAHIWPYVLDRGLEIGFAHTSFKWHNNAKGKAGVTCVIVGVRNKSSRPRYLYAAGAIRQVENISPYLTAGRTLFVHRASTPISPLPQMIIGNMARDGGHLMLSPEQASDLLSKHPEARPIVRKLLGTDELISGKSRFCLWIDDRNLSLAKSIPVVQRRIDAVFKFRTESKAKTTNGYAKISHKFAQRCLKEERSIIVPSTTSERREYIPMDFLEPGAVITNSANAIYGAEAYVFGLVTSRMHMVWVRAVGGQLETRLRYSAEMCYNTFPIPRLSNKQKAVIDGFVLNILEEREKHPEAAMEELYDPDLMPSGLRTAHQELDAMIESCYRSRAFLTDEDRLEHLFNLYERMSVMGQTESLHA